MTSDEYELLRLDPTAFAGKLFQLRDYQGKAIINATMTEYNTINSWPRQAGKDMTVSVIAMWHLLFKPYSRVLVYSPTHSFAAVFRAQLLSLIEKYGHAPIIHESHNHTISLGNGSTIKFRVPDHSTLQRPTSESFDIVLINELKIPLDSDYREMIRKVVDMELDRGAKVHMFGGHTPIYQGFMHYKVTWRDFMTPEHAISVANTIGMSQFEEEFGN